VLLKEATRLFEGRVAGSESVAVVEQTGELLMLDKFGWLHVGKESSSAKGGYELSERTAYVTTVR
jgi:hypothetical protein